MRSRLKLAELEAEHKLRTQWLLHLFVMTVVAVPFLVGTYIVMFKDATTGLPDKATGIITAIVAGGVGYITGKSSKSPGRFVGPVPTGQTNHISRTRSSPAKVFRPTVVTVPNPA